MDSAVLDIKKNAAEEAAFALMRLVRGIENIACERSSENSAGEPSPRVMPHDLAKKSSNEFNKIVALHDERLSASCSRSDIERVEEEFRDFHRACCSESSFKQLVDNMGEETSFEEGWKAAGDLFSALR